MKTYEPPAGDEPLDEIERAIVRALVPILVDKIRADAAAALKVPDAALNTPAAAGEKPDQRKAG